MGFALSKDCLSHEILDRRVLIILGNSLRIVGGWLDWMFMYTGWSLGLQYGRYDPSVSDSVMSRTSAQCMLMLMVMSNPLSLKSLMSRFLVRSAIVADICL